jgi:DNA-binding transcriptional LysR family regulator
LVSAPDRFPARIEMRMLSQEPMVFVCRPDHHLAQCDDVGITELAEEDLIGFPAEFGLRRLVEDAFTAAGITSHTPYEVAADYSVAASLVRHGLGTIFMPAGDRSIPHQRRCSAGIVTLDAGRLSARGSAAFRRLGAAKC